MLPNLRLHRKLTSDSTSKAKMFLEARFPTRIHHRVEECLRDFDKAPKKDVNDSSPEPMNTPVIEPEETLPELQPEARTRQRRRWDDLPLARVTRSHIPAANICSLSDEELIEVFCATAVKVFLARTGGPKVHEALESGIVDGIKYFPYARA